MEPCVNCGTVEPVVPVPSCDCQTLNPCGGDARETRLLAPTRHEHDEWTANDPILPEGVLGLVKDRLFEGSVEYIIGDGEHTYTELLEEYRIYAGAPLSRTGAANHSPLAASGKSTLDPSWLPDATSSAKGAVMTSTTGAAGKVPIAASGASALDPSWLPAATNSALGGVMTSTTGASGKVPIAGNSGKLDPSWFPEATSTTLGAVKASTTKAADNVVKADSNGGLGGWKDSIIDAIIADDGSGGLVTDAGGNLAVDFSQMPTDKFEALLKSLKMLIPLTANMDLFVDTNNAAAGDTIVDGRGTRALPFKTIQAAVNFATGTYAVGNYHINIRVVAGTYNESVSLPDFSRGTGYIEIMPDSGDKDVIVNAELDSSGTRTTNFTASGGFWHLSYLIAQRIEHATDAVNYPTMGCFHSSNSAIVELYGCSAIQALPVAGESVGGSNYAVRLISADYGGTIRLRHGRHPHVIQCEAPASGYPSSVVPLFVSRNGVIQIYRSSYDTVSHLVECSGSCSSFLSGSQNGQVSRVSTGTALSFTGNVTGKRYALTEGATAVTGNPATYFPGTIEGTVEADTYCWYK